MICSPWRMRLGRDKHMFRGKNTQSLQSTRKKSYVYFEACRPWKTVIYPCTNIEHTLSIILIPSKFPYRVAFCKRQWPSVVQVMDQTSNRSSALKYCPVFVISCLLTEASDAVSPPSVLGHWAFTKIPPTTRELGQLAAIGLLQGGRGNSCPFTEAQVTA